MELKIYNKTKYTKDDLQRFRQTLGEKYLSFKEETVIAHYFLKDSLAKQFNKSFDEITIYKNEHGKPYCEYGIFFSISHSDNFIVIAFSNDEIGVDIECKRKINPKLLHKCFNECDFEFVDKSKFDSSFLRLWTTKEAYFKLIGTGITNLKSINISEIHSNYTVETIETDNYILSIVTHKK